MNRILVVIFILIRTRIALGNVNIEKIDSIPNTGTQISILRNNDLNADADLDLTNIRCLAMGYDFIMVLVVCHVM